MKYIVIVLFCLIAFKISAQKNISIKSNTTICTAVPLSANDIKLRPVLKGDDSNMYEILDKIKVIVGMEDEEILLFESVEPIENAFATHINGQKVIVYDAQFLAAANSKGTTKWAAISIMAHEIGHHFHHHLQQRSTTLLDSQAKELEADALSGFVLAKLGAAKEAAVKAMMLYGTALPSTHPNRIRRLNAIANGWEQGKR